MPGVRPGLNRFLFSIVIKHLIRTGQSQTIDDKRFKPAVNTFAEWSGVYERPTAPSASNIFPLDPSSCRNILILRRFDSGAKRRGPMNIHSLVRGKFLYLTLLFRRGSHPSPPSPRPRPTFGPHSKFTSGCQNVPLMTIWIRLYTSLLDIFPWKIKSDSPFT